MYIQKRISLVEEQKKKKQIYRMVKEGWYTESDFRMKAHGNEYTFDSVSIVVHIYRFSKETNAYVVIERIL